MKKEDSSSYSRLLENDSLSIKENIINTLQDLIKIKTYQEGGMEQDGVEYLEKRLKKMQVEYDLLYYKNHKIGIVASIGTGENSLILHSHLDTVPPADENNWTKNPFQPSIKTKKIFGLGACDDKGSLAAMLVTFESLIPVIEDLNGRLLLMVVGGEERGGIGSQIAMQKGYKAEAAVLGEPTNLEPKFAHKGVIRLEITIKGNAAHASSPRKGVNSISYMAKLIPLLDKLSLTVEKETEPYTGHASMAITTINGGTAVNVIPDQCVVSIDRRIIPGQQEEYIISQIKKVLQEFQDKNPTVKVFLKKIRSTQPAFTEPDELIGKVSLKVASEELQKTIQPAGFTACCDMTFLRNEGNMPVVIIGPGDIKQAHQKDEFVEIESLLSAYRIYKNIALQWLTR